MISIRNSNSSKLAKSYDFGAEFALWLNLLHDYEFGIVKNYSDLAPVYCLLPIKPSFVWRAGQKTKTG